MGSTDEERTRKIYVAISKMVENSRGLPAGDPYFEPLISMVGDLWHGMLGSISNPTLWLTGSGMLEPSYDNVHPYYVGMIHSLPELDLLEDVREKKDLDEIYSRFDPFENFLNIGDLLSVGGLKWPRCVFEIILWADHLAYALRRYDDQFLAEHSSLNKLLSSIMGETYAIVAEHQIFARAFYLMRICQLIYGTDDDLELKSDVDPVAQLAIDQCWHHKLSRQMDRSDCQSLVSLSRCRQMLQKNAESEDPLSKKFRRRIMFALVLMGRKFHYEHEFEKILEFCRTHEITTDELEKRFEANVTAHDEHDRKSAENYGEKKKLGSRYDDLLKWGEKRQVSNHFPT